MTTLEDDIRSALQLRAAAHEVVVPDLDQLVREPYASGGSPVPRRRVLIGAAAAVLAAGLGATAVALVSDDDDPKPRPLIQVPPTPGTFGAILTGLGPPVDGSELEWDLPPGTTLPDPDAAGPLVVLRSDDGDDRPVAVVAFSRAEGHSSFDVWSLASGTPTTIGGLAAIEHAPDASRPGLTTLLEVDRGAGERLFAAGFGIERSDVVALAEAALSVFNVYAPWWQDLGYEPLFTGVDRNPFKSTVGDERTLGYAVDGRAVTVTFEEGAADPADYAWFVDGTVTADADGRRILRWTSVPAGPGRTGATWAEAGGQVVVNASEEDLDAAVGAVRMVDAATWEAERARATEPGSRFQTGTTSMPPR